MCIAMSGSFNNGNFDLKLPIAKIKLHQIKALYGIQVLHISRDTLLMINWRDLQVVSKSIK